MSSVATFQSLIPEYASAAEADIEVWLEVAASLHTASRWGSVYATAMCFYAAHCMKSLGYGLAAPGSVAGASGAVTSRKKGDLAESYGDGGASKAATASDAELMTTAYGRRYLAIRRSRASGRAGILLLSDS